MRTSYQRSTIMTGLKKSFVSLIMLCLILPVFSQHIRIRCIDEPLNRIIVTLRDTGKIMVSFDDRLLSGYTLTVDENFESIPIALDYLFEDIPLDYEFTDGVYLIFPIPVKEEPLISPVLEISPKHEVPPLRRTISDEFKKAAEMRKNAAMARMIDIRKAEKVYKDQKLRYTGSFDTLVSFLKNDSILVVNAIGVVPVSLIDSLKDMNKAKEMAVRRGLIQGITYRVAAIDSVFAGRKNIIDSLRFVPFTDGANFNMKAGALISSSGLPVQLIEISVPFEVLFKGLVPEEIRIYTDDWMKAGNYPGLRLGSLEAATLKGNWE